MKTNVTRKKNIAIRRMIILSILGLLSIFILFTGFLVLKTLGYNKVYDGVYINDFNARGLTKDELITSLKTNFSDNLKSKDISINFNGFSKDIPLADLNVKYDINAVADKAYSIGRGGISTIFSQYTKKKQKHILDLIYTYDKSKIEAVFAKMDKKSSSLVKEHELIVKNDSVVLKTGHPGQVIDRESTIKSIENSLKDFKFSPIEAKSIVAEPAKIDVDALYKKINSAPKDAKFVAEGKEYKIIDHVVGRSIDKSDLASIVEKVEKTSDTETIIPVDLKEPKITTEKINQNLFVDTFSSFSTKFKSSSTNDANRAVNIKIAAGKINGTILAPGDEFSFLNAIGRPTAENGYKIAHTYVAGKVVDGIGGGLCQVSTTMYNAVLLSDLLVTRRSNHQMVVYYVSFGRDAAIYHPDVDFKFKNSTKWPIKISCTATKSTISFSIIGKNDTPNKTVTISTKTLKVYPRPVKTIDDPTLNEGVTKVVDNGEDGYVVDTFKTVKMDGKVISDKKIHTSYYRTLAKEVHKGTKKAAGNATPTASANKVKSTPKPNVNTNNDNNTSNNTDNTNSNTDNWDWFKIKKFIVFNLRRDW